jgi:hypothetical protein
MGFTWAMSGRLSKEGAAYVAAQGLAAFRDDLAAKLAEPPAASTILACYGCDDHEWDVLVLGYSETDDPAVWAKMQVVGGRAVGFMERSRLLRLADADAFDAVSL